MKVIMINNYKKIVIKIGSSSIINSKNKKINSKWMEVFCKDIAQLHRNSKIVIVCSGAIALGSNLIKKNKSLRKLEDKQAAASVGQIELAHQWRQKLKKYKINVAQVLLTLDDSEVRKRYLNARKTMNSLLSNKIVVEICKNIPITIAIISFW